jgi:hypothetical protein
MTTAIQKEMQRSYKEIIELVATVVNEWDPYDLISVGAPDNEFAHEVAQIAAKVHEINTPSELAEVISKVFSISFGSEYFSVTACMQVAGQLFTVLQTHGLLEQTKSMMYNKAVRPDQ